MGRLGRPRAGARKLTREKVLEVALRLVDEHGLEALSMRRLAAELGVDPMAIYHHLPGKDAVVSGMVALVCSGMRMPTSGDGTWQERVRAWARAYRSLTLAHPNLVLKIVSDAAAVSEVALLVGEPLYEALEGSGLPPDAVVRASDTLADYVHGFVLAEAAQKPGGRYDRREFLAGLDGLPESEVPAMRRVYGALPEEEAIYDFDSGFEAGLDVILSGIEAGGRG